MDEWRLIAGGVTAGLAALCVTFHRVERGREDALSGGVPDAARKPARRAMGDLSPGEAILRVQVPAGGDKPVNLGTSKESYESVSASPTLSCTGVSLVAEDGTPLELPAGASLEIRAIYGARRNVIESITEPTGVVHVFSFEVLPGTWLWRHGRLPEAAGQSSPFRDGPRRIEPRGQAIVLSGEEIPQDPTRGSSCWLALLTAILLGSIPPIVLSWDTVWAIVACTAGVFFIMGLVAMPPKPKT
jgi:hypothetical protein